MLKVLVQKGAETHYVSCRGVVQCRRDAHMHLKLCFFSCSSKPFSNTVFQWLSVLKAASENKNRVQQMEFECRNEPLDFMHVPRFSLSESRRIIPAFCIANGGVLHWERSCSASTSHLCTALTSLFVSAYQSRSLFLCGDPIETPWLSRAAPDSDALFDCCLATALSLKSRRRLCVSVRR